jgi:CheY-like chemotaxis protein
MDYKRNPNYGRAKCFHCLLSPERDDPIFIGINGLVVIGLKQDENENSPIQYPCPVTNRFACPYEKGKSSNAIFDVNDLFDLANMAFAVEISLAVARRDTSAIQIKNKQDFYQALTNRKIFDMILKLVVEEFKPHFYDLLLTDIYMPNMNGFELCEKILELDVNIRVCFMSALEVNIRASAVRSHTNHNR